MHPYNLGELVHYMPEETSPRRCHAASRRDRAVARLRHRFGWQGGVRAGPWHHHRRTIGLLLTRKAVNATVTLCAIREPRMCVNTCDGPIMIVAAMGVAGFVKPEDIKEGSILVDVGVSACSTSPADTRSRVMSIKPVTRGFGIYAESWRRRADDACHAVAECRGDGRTSVVSFAIVLSGVCDADTPDFCAWLLVDFRLVCICTHV